LTINAFISLHIIDKRKLFKLLIIDTYFFLRYFDFDCYFHFMVVITEWLIIELKIVLLVYIIFFRRIILPYI